MTARRLQATVPHSARSAVMRLLSHPGPRYLVAGGITFALDAGLLALLHGGLHVQLAAATVIAFTVAFAANFTISRTWTFPAGGRTPRAQLLRYVVLVMANLVSTVLIVTGLAATGLNYLVAKACAAMANAVVNFFVSRHWIFR